MIFGKNRAFLYPTKVLADTNNLISDLARAGWIIVQGECNQACLNCWAAADDVNKGPMEHIAQGKRSGTLGLHDEM